MTVFELLTRDLERQYYFGGRGGRKASLISLIMALGNARFLPVFLYRLSHLFYVSNCRYCAKAVSLVNFVLFGLEIATQCEIGPGLYLPHTVGTVIGASRIGRNAVIYHQVTIGAKKMDVGFTAALRPAIGDNVVIGSGAKVLGEILVGDNVIIGANAVVTKSVPCNVVMGGIPAKILKYRTDC